MTQEDKELLLKDLCARLPYGVVCKTSYSQKASLESISKEGTIIDVIFRGDTNEHFIEDVKPYLRPISTMTEEEQFQLGRLLGATLYNLLKGEYSSLKELLEYVYKNHIDLFGLIPKGLAIEAPDDMYK